MSDMAQARFCLTRARFPSLVHCTANSRLGSSDRSQQMSPFEPSRNTVSAPSGASRSTVALARNAAGAAMVALAISSSMVWAGAAADDASSAAPARAIAAM